MGCSPVIGVREGSLLATGKWQKWWESVGLSWVMMGCQGLAGMRAEKALWRVTGSCRGVSEMGEEGESVTRCRRLFRRDRGRREGWGGWEMSWAAVYKWTSEGDGVP